MPDDDVDKVAAAMHEAGAGAIGAYDRAMFQAPGTGSFRPLDGATPAIGEVGEVEHVSETRVEMVAAPSPGEAVRAAMVAAHPYEEVAYSVTASAPRPVDRGSGRIGQLAEPMSLGDFAAHVTDRLPAHHSADPRGRRPRPDDPHGRAVRRVRRLPAGPCERVGCRRLRHVGPAAPPGERAPETTGRLCRHRRAALGRRVDVAAGRSARGRGTLWRYGGDESVDDRHRPVDARGIPSTRSTR